MARNPVQFQKGISLNAFLSLYGTEDQCFDALYQWRWPNGFLCPHCGHDRCCQLNSRKLQQCNRTANSRHFFLRPRKLTIVGAKFFPDYPRI